MLLSCIGDNALMRVVEGNETKEGFMNGLFKSIVVACGMSVALASAAAADPVEERKELMKSVGKSMKIAVPMAKGETAYDAAAAADAMKTINGVPDKFVTLFPAGSDQDPDTTASPKLWENMDDFKAKANGLKEASADAIDAAAKGHEEFKAALFGSVAKTCKGCHEAYRIKKE